MAARLRIPIIALSVVSLALNVAILGCAGQSLDVFQRQRFSNAWFMPVWTNHFDTRELWALLGTSIAVVILNLVLIIAPFIALPSAASLLLLASPALSFAVSLIALIYASILTANRGNSDTLQSWTCRWRNVPEQNVPQDFGALCHETRFAYYATIPSFMLQILLLGLGVSSVLLTARRSQRGLRRLQGEKDHELGQVRRASFGEGSSPPDSVRILAGDRKS